MKTVAVPTEHFKKQYRDLEMRVMRSLREAIENSNYRSKRTGAKAIQVNLFDYVELTVIDERLIFLDNNGHQYSIFTDATIEDLIDILTEQNT